LVADYLADAPRHVAELRATAGARDAPTLAARAHKLAGMSLAIGAVEVARSCVHIERLASRGEVREAAEHIDEVAAQLAAAGAELNRLIGA
jgi:HPt (histidine-containing phosphotransfer) domain-containing protein